MCVAQVKFICTFECNFVLLHIFHTSSNVHCALALPPPPPPKLNGFI